jgi:hypothetical protein
MGLKMWEAIKILEEGGRIRSTETSLSLDKLDYIEYFGYKRIIAPSELFGDSSWIEEEPEELHDLISASLPRFSYLWKNLKKDKSWAPGQTYYVPFESVTNQMKKQCGLVKCECGADKAGSPCHSNWCPVYEEEK